MDLGSKAWLINISGVSDASGVTVAEHLSCDFPAGTTTLPLGFGRTRFEAMPANLPSFSRLCMRLCKEGQHVEFYIGDDDDSSSSPM